MGYPILILHGWGSSSRSWTGVKDILVSQGFNVFVPDLPGFGGEKPSETPWTVSDYENWVLNFAQQNRLERFFLLGHSFGGRVAIKFSVEHPGKVAGLILCGSAGIKGKAGFKAKIIIGLTRIGNAVFSPSILKRFKDSARNLFYNFLRGRDYVKAKGVMKETFKEVLAEDLLPYLRRIRVKTLLVWGEKDKMVPLKQAYIFKEQIENSELEILPKMGHALHLANPEKLSEIIINFLKTFN